MTDPADRYDAARRAGIKDRAFNLPLEPKENERMSFAAEKFFGDRYGLKANEGLNVGGGGPDFKLGDVTIDVKWTPRENGRLVVSMRSLSRDFYVLVIGPDPDHFRLMGYASRLEAMANVRDLGHGPCYAIDQDALHADVDALMDELQRAAAVLKTERNLDLGDFMSW